MGQTVSKYSACFCKTPLKPEVFAIQQGNETEEEFVVHVQFDGTMNECVTRSESSVLPLMKYDSSERVYMVYRSSCHGLPEWPKVLTMVQEMKMLLFVFYKEGKNQTNIFDMRKTQRCGHIEGSENVQRYFQDLNIVDLKPFATLMIESENDALASLKSPDSPQLFNCGGMYYTVCDRDVLKCEFGHDGEFVYSYKTRNMESVDFMHIIFLLDNHLPVYAGCVTSMWKTSVSPKEIEELIDCAYITPERDDF